MMTDYCYVDFDDTYCLHLLVIIYISSGFNLTPHSVFVHFFGVRMRPDFG